MHEFTYRFCPACGAPLEARLLRPGEPARPVCAVCGFVHYANPKVAVGTIIEADDSAARFCDLGDAGTGQRPVPPVERPVPPQSVGQLPASGAPRARPARTEWGLGGPASERAGGSAGAEPPGLILVRRAIEPGYGRWVFPGGFVDRGEPLETAAIREAREETGLDVRLDALVNVYSYPGAPVVVVVYAAGIVGGRLAVDEESLEAGRFPRARIPWGELAFDSTRDALHDYLAGLRHPIHSTAPKS